MLARHTAILFSLFFPLFCYPAFADADQQGEEVAHRTLTAIGTLTPLFKSTLGSVVSGRVEAVYVEVGDSVTKGQPLLVLDQAFFEIAVAEAKVALESAKIEGEDAERNFERMKKLFEKPEGQMPSISQKRFEDAKTHLEQAQAGLERAAESLKKAKKNLTEATIKAPYDGVITKRLVHPGEPINATPVTKLLEIVSIDSLYIEFSLPQVYTTFVRKGTPVHVTIEGTEMKEGRAVIDSIFPDIDEKTRSIRCRATIPNPSRMLHPGALVRLLIPIEEIECASS